MQHKQSQITHFSGYRITNGFRTSFALSFSHFTVHFSHFASLFLSSSLTLSLSLSAHFLLSLSEELSWLDLRSKRSATQRLFVVAFFHKVFVRKSRISLLCSPFHAFLSFCLSVVCSVNTRVLHMQFIISRQSCWISLWAGQIKRMLSLEIHSLQGLSSAWLGRLHPGLIWMLFNTHTHTHTHTDVHTRI